MTAITTNDYFEDLGRSKAADDPRFRELLDQIAVPLGPYDKHEFEDLVQLCSELRTFIKEFAYKAPTIGEAGLFAAAGATKLGDKRAARRVVLVLACLRSSIEQLRDIMNEEMAGAGSGSAGSGSSGPSRTRRPSGQR